MNSEIQNKNLRLICYFNCISLNFKNLSIYIYFVERNEAFDARSFRQSRVSTNKEPFKMELMFMIMFIFITSIIQSY